MRPKHFGQQDRCQNGNRDGKKGQEQKLNENTKD
jgi:hypothetical protein